MEDREDCDRHPIEREYLWHAEVKPQSVFHLATLRKKSVGRMFSGDASTVFTYQLQWICAIDRKPSWSCSCEYFRVCIKASVEYLDGVGRRDGVSSQVHGGRQVKFPNMDLIYFLTAGPDPHLQCGTNKYSTCKYSTDP